MYYSYWASQYNSLIITRNLLSDRMAAVRNVISILSNRPVNDVQNIRRTANNCSDSIAAAIYGSRKIQNLSSQCSNLAVTACETDSWGDREYLEAEITRLNQEIQRVQGNINWAWSKMQEEKAQATEGS